jgi:hypothetical protein
MWGVKAPKRVSFIWTGALGKILTCDNLMRRGMFWPVGVACVRAAGRRGNLLLHCAFASELWGFVFKTFGIYWVIPTRVLSLRNFDVPKIFPFCSPFLSWDSHWSCNSTLLPLAPPSTEKLSCPCFL